MKYLFYILIFAFFNSCSSKAELFEIKGKIANTTANKISLAVLAIGSKNPLIIDTTTLAKDGSFILKAPYSTTESIHLISIGSSKEFYIINDVPSITLNADLDNYRKYTTAESTASNQLHQFLEAYNNLYPNLLIAITNHDSIEKLIVSDSIKTIYQTKKEKELTIINTLISENILNTKSEALTAFLIAKGIATMPVDKINMLTKKALATYPKSMDIVQLHSILKSNEKSKKIIIKDTSTIIIQKDTIPKPRLDTLKKIISPKRAIISKKAVDSIL